jgi:putative ABC transport system permease protein
MTLLEDRPSHVSERPEPSEVRVTATAPWRLAARLARREVRRRPWRTLLVVVLVAVPVAALVLADVAYRTDRLPSDARFGTASTQVSLGGQPLSFGDETLEEALPAGTPYAWWYETNLPLRSAAAPEHMVFTAAITIDPTDPMTAGIVDVVSGRNTIGPDEVTLTASTAEQFGVDVGDRLELVRPAQAFTVVGIVDVADRSDAMIAPGFDVSALRPSARQITVLAGRDGDDSLEALDLASPFQSGGWQIERRADEGRADPMALFFGWLAGAIAMGILGIIVASAFAVSGRRQLVTIGQLSATGADASVLRRFLALQGTWSGVAGTILGMAGGAALVAALDDQIRNEGRLSIDPADIAIIAVTAITVASVAALVPTRSLAQTSVLTALGGRRPVPPVRARQVRVGTALIAGGLLALVLSVGAADAAGADGGSVNAAALLAAAAGIALLAGVCCLAPVAVSVIGRLGRNTRGALRLAIRDLDRHRARSGALIAAVIVVGAGAVAGGSLVERNDRDQYSWCCTTGPDVINIQAYTFDGVEAPPPVDEVAPDIRDRVEAIAGPVRWVAPQTVTFDDERRVVAATIADPVGLRIGGLDDAEIERALAADVTQVIYGDDGPMAAEERSIIAAGLGVPVDQLDVATILRPAGPGFATFVSAAAVERANLITYSDSSLYGLADHDITRDEYTQLSQLGGSSDAFYFVDVSPDEMQISVMAPSPVRDWTKIARWSVIGAALLLVSLVVALGLALWAAEGREEHDTLVTLGAKPSTIATMAGWKALLLAGAGGILAVPLGYGTLLLCLRAAGEQTVFPWETAIGVAVVIPAVIAVASFCCSSLAQRARLVRAVLANVD